nr:hypothetical protein Iba_chr02fCG6660 [Ipomoea batatas]
MEADDGWADGATAAGWGEWKRMEGTGEADVKDMAKEANNKLVINFQRKPDPGTIGNHMPVSKLWTNLAGLSHVYTTCNKPCRSDLARFALCNGKNSQDRRIDNLKDNLVE